MGLALDLDEIEESKLRAELERRAQAREMGLCDYCGREGDETPCKMKERHKVAADLLVKQRRRQRNYELLKAHSLALQAGTVESETY